MTTTSERLLQIAEQYTQKASALRLAAQELHDERTVTATQKLGQRLSAAVATRAATRNGNGGGGHNTAAARVTKQRRREIIQNLISDGSTHTAAEIMAYLSKRHHLRASSNIIWLDLKELGAKKNPDVQFGYYMPSSNGHASTSSNGTQATRDAHGTQTEGRRKVILALLRKGPQQIKDLQLALNAAGYMIQRDRTRQFITDHIPEAHCEGVAHQARWVLGNVKGIGKLSTAKPHGKKPRTPGYTSKVRAQRERSLALLEQFDTTTPSKPPAAMKAGAVGVYVRRGYLKAKDDGYIRTAKPFSLEIS